MNNLPFRKILPYIFFVIAVILILSGIRSTNPSSQNLNITELADQLRNNSPLITGIIVDQDEMRVTYGNGQTAISHKAAVPLEQELKSLGVPQQTIDRVRIEYTSSGIIPMLQAILPLLLIASGFYMLLRRTRGINKPTQGPTV